MNVCKFPVDDVSFCLLSPLATQSSISVHSIEDALLSAAALQLTLYLFCCFAHSKWKACLLEVTLHTVQTLNLVGHICNPGAGEAKTGRLPVQGKAMLHSKTLANKRKEIPLPQMQVKIQT